MPLSGSGRPPGKNRKKGKGLKQKNMGGKSWMGKKKLM